MPDDQPVPWPWSVKEMPLSIHDLIGRPIRIVPHGGVVTMEYVSGRVTITLTEDGHHIEDIKIEPGLPLPKL